ncbi:hypothetical protein ACLOJK_013016 [Asimina triloba]
MRGPPDEWSRELLVLLHGKKPQGDGSDISPPCDFVMDSNTPRFNALSAAGNDKRRKRMGFSQLSRARALCGFPAARTC